MIIHSFNDYLSDALVDELSKTIKVDKFIYPRPGVQFPIYSSYNESPTRHFPPALESHYDQRLDEVLDELDLLDRTVNDVMKWCQIYNKSTSGFHPTHTHFSGDQLLSMVHFIRTPKDQKCFYFISKGEKYYPDTQNSGDFIVFPSWASHGVDPVECDDNDRIIVSINIHCKQYKDNMNLDDILVCSKKYRKNMLTKVWSEKL